MNKQVWRSRAYRQHVLDTIAMCPDIIIFDTETSGLKADDDRIIELAAIRYFVGEDGTLQEITRLHQYIHPPFSLPQKIVEITGITNEKLESEPTEDACFARIQSFFGVSPLVLGGHNVGFDTRFLSALYKRNGDSLGSYVELDTLEMARDRVRAEDTKDYKLGTLAHLFGLDNGVQFHSAIEDVQVTAKLFEIFYKEYLEEDNEDSGSCIRPAVQKISYWPGYKGFARIYVELDCGSVYYDVRTKSWSPKESLDMNTIDMEYVQQEALRLTGSTNLIQFSRFTGQVTA